MTMFMQVTCEDLGLKVKYTTLNGFPAVEVRCPWTKELITVYTKKGLDFILSCRKARFN